MKNYKNLYVVIIVLILGLITCIYLLIKEKQRKNIILETTQFLSILTKMFIMTLIHALINMIFISG